MKQLFLYLIFVFPAAFVSCKKETVVQPPATIPQPVVEMEYINLNNRSITINTPAAVLDVNNDGAYDLIFTVLLVGDPINKVDKSQFTVISSYYTSLPVNINEQVLSMKRSDLIPVNHFNGSNWYNASGIVLIEKNEFATGAIVWRGNWLGSVKQYLPFQVLKNNLRYNGWVELTEDKANERIILHQAAISKEAEKNIKAGL